MDSKTELIKRQMDDTRTGLTDKLGQLEQQVTETVQGVTQTVQGATAAVTETVGNVQEAVAETVQTVRDTVQETVQTVKESFDLRRHVRDYPWLMMAGAAGVGWLVGSLLPSGRESEALDGDRAPSDSSGRHAIGNLSSTETSGDSPPHEPGFIENLGTTLMQHLEPVKGLALGTVFGLVREAVEPALPKEWTKPLREVIDGITVDLGGTPVPPVDRSHEDSSAHRVAT